MVLAVRREAEGLFSGRAFLGRVAVRIPRRGSPPEEGWFELRAGDKHADELAARCRRAGRPPGELGELKLSVERVEPRPSDDDSGRASPRTPHGRGAEAEPPRRRAAATPPTPDDDDDDADQARHPRHCRHTHNDDEISASHPREAVHATHVHVAVVAARGLLPSDFEAAEAGEKGDAAPSSDPYASARLLPALPEERHVTRVLPRTTDPLWEVRAKHARAHAKRLCLRLTCAGRRRRSSSSGACTARTAWKSRRAGAGRMKHRELKSAAAFLLALRFGTTTL